jgi:hypothetical protein
MSRTVCSARSFPPATNGVIPLLSVRLDNGRDVVISEDSYRNIDHGYAATIHKSQGATVDRTFVLATGMMDQHLTYVSMTRHRDRADLYAARRILRRSRNGVENPVSIIPPASPASWLRPGWQSSGPRMRMPTRVPMPM